MDKTGIGDKVKFLLQLSKRKEYTHDELNYVISLTSLHSNDLVLGKVFGYSVSDYALATLYWLDTPDTIEIFNNLFKELSITRKSEINKLIEKKIYEQC